LSSKNKKSRYRNDRLPHSFFLFDYSSSKISLTQGALQRQHLLRGVRLGLLPQTKMSLWGDQRRSPAFNDSLLGEP
jgi:hypothetical protein